MSSMGTLHICLIFVALLFRFPVTNGQVDDVTLQLISKVLEKQEEQTNIIGQQQEQIDKLTNRLTKQQAALDHYNTRFFQQETHIEILEDIVTRHEATIKMLRDDQAQLIKPENTADGHINEIPKTKRTGMERSKGPQNRISKARIRQDRLVVDSSEGPVVFHATVSKTEVDHIGVNQKIVFETVLLNIGAAYHNQHGLFIAPQSGVYMFSTSIMSFNSAAHPEIWAAIKKNGKTLAMAYGHSDSGRHDQGSVTVFTQLTTGDEVWVGLVGPADNSLWGLGYTSFAGCLIVQM